jgi:hypothetical protein
MTEVVVGIACEDDGHFSAIIRLVDHELVMAHSWLDGIVENCRSWRGVRQGELWYKYDPKDADDVRPIEVGGKRISPQGHIAGEPLKPEAGMWRRVLLHFCHVEPRPNLVILVRDLDGYPERWGGLTQVRNGLTWPFAIVVAAPQPEIEAWRVAGFVPNDVRERRELDALKRDLSFDPTTESHRLTSHPNDVATDAKRVLERLCGNDRERRDACLAVHSRLYERGCKNGLAPFLDEIDQCVVPLFGRTT